MNRERWLRVKELFAEALEMPQSDRGAYIGSACRDDQQLRDEVEGLLRAHTTAGTFMGSPTVDTAADDVDLQPVAPPGEPAAKFPERLGDFRLIRRLGGGGMGVVYLARQESLGRQVALKVVRPDQMYFRDTRERFQREVEAVARLKHPGIVPILTVGDEKGVPYFVMEFVDGCSLADALAEVRRQVGSRQPTGIDLRRAVATLTGTSEARSDAEGLYAGSWARIALRIVRRVAMALNHAHENGILHRDVKPSNLMLCPDGRVLLLDFGVARMQDHAEITRTGSTLGSLPYMSPEQVRGDVDVDERVDVYGLGVTLYETLTHNLPFSESDSERLRKAILDGAPEPPRKLTRGIPRDVETVCLKAMDLDRGRRYRGMAEFAHDLDNCLELRPIDARRTGTLLRLGRWIQRNPARALAGGLALLLVLGAPSALWLQQRSANELLRRATARAEENRDRALQAVHEMLTVVAEMDLKEIPGLKPVRLELLDRACRFFDSFLETEGSNLTVRRQAARSQCRLGVLQLELGRVDDALLSLGEARRLLAPMVAGKTASSNDLLTLTIALRLSGHTRAQRGDLESADLLFLDALQVDDEFLAESPGASKHVRSKCRTLNELAGLRIRQQRFEETVDLRLDAVEAMDNLVATQPDNLEWQSQLGVLCSNLVYDLRRMDRNEEAEAIGLRATSVLEHVVALEPSETHRDSFGGALHALGFHYMAMGRLAEAVPCYERALLLAEALVRDYPDTPEHHASIGRSANNIAQILNGSGRHQEARQMAERAVVSQKRALAIVPGNAHFLDNLCFHYEALGDALAHLAQIDALHEMQVEQVEIRPDTSRTARDAAAKCLILAAQIDGLELTAEERESIQERERRRAVRWLELAAERGMAAGDLDEVWLDSLRKRADFVALKNRLDANR